MKTLGQHGHEVKVVRGGTTRRVRSWGNGKEKERQSAEEKEGKQRKRMKEKENGK